MAVLVLLASRPGSTISHQDFRDQVWDGRVVEIGSLARCIAEIRSALGDSAHCSRLIETVPHRGYRIIAPVVRAAAPEPITAPPIAGQVRPGRSRRAVLARYFLLAAGLGALLIMGGIAGRQKPARPGAVVAAFGFSSLTADPASEWLGPALEQMLSIELAISPLARVIPPDVAFYTAKEHSVPPDQLPTPRVLELLRDSLDVSHVVTGSYLLTSAPDSATLRLDLMVVDAYSGEIVAAAIENGPLDELSSLVLSAGQEFRERLGLGVGAADRLTIGGQGIPDDPEAARLYFRALSELRRADPVAARTLLESSVEIDAKSVFSRLALAETWAALGFDARAAAQADQALDLIGAGWSPESRLWPEARAYSLRGEWPVAVTRLDALCLIAPENLEYALALVRAKLHTGETASALRTLQDLARDRLSTTNEARLTLAEAEARAVLGEYGPAAEAARRAQRAADRVHAPLLHARAILLEAQSLYELGDVRTAERALSSVLEFLATESATHQRLEAEVRLEGARWMQIQGRFEPAYLAASAAADAFARMGDRRGEARALHQVGTDLWRQGSHEQGRAALERSVELAREIEDKNLEASSLRALAIAEASYGDGERVETLFEAALALYRQAGNRDGIASMLNNLGRVAAFSLDMELAVQRYEEAERIFSELGIPDGRANVLFNLAHAYLETAEIERARMALEEATHAFAELANERMLAASLESLSQVLAIGGRFSEARTVLSRSQQLVASLGDGTRSLRVVLSEARLALAEGDAGTALAVAERAREFTAAEDLPLWIKVATEAMVAEVLLVAGEPERARAALPAAMPEERRPTMESFRYQLLRARIEAATRDRDAATARLSGLRSEASRRGLEKLRLEAGLALVEISPGETQASAELIAALRKSGLIALAARAERSARVRSRDDAPV